VSDHPQVVLVTGVTGQDGSYLAERLVAEGHDVHGLVHHSDTAKVTAGVTVQSGDITEHDELRRLVVDVGPDLVFNLAGISSVATSWEHPLLTAQTTGVAAEALMEASWAAQERSGREVRFLQASSAEIFGQAESSPQDETTPIRPVNPYGAAKAFAHHCAHVYRQRGLFASSVILFNHESPRRPPGFVTRKITSGAAAIARGEADTLALGNLDARRDWGWAPDYVDAMLRAVRHDKADDYVVATGVAHSVRDFVDAAFRRAGVPDWEGLVVQDERFFRPAEATVLCGDAGRARRVLGWEPTTTFDELVGRMVDADLAESP
jgi:GDPmannose 4,6-dehydratase